MQYLTNFVVVAIAAGIGSFAGNSLWAMWQIHRYNEQVERREASDK